MLVSLMSSCNSVTFNTAVAGLLGLHPAIYIAELSNIYDKAIRKNKVEDFNGCQYFTLDRKYMKQRTTFEEDEQKRLDEYLEAVDLLKRRNTTDKKDVIHLNLQLLADMLNPKTATEAAQVKQFLKKTSATKTKKDFIADKLKQYIKTDNPDLKMAYYTWINSILESGKKPLTSVIVQKAQEDIDNYSNRVLDVALKILDAATRGDYTNMIYAIERYENDQKLYQKVDATVKPTEAATQDNFKWGEVVF